ncbi:MAG TPA: hypothetical protein VD971_10790 [Phycisphaerales bacterium]|nr:hypothetical protein [Phycisphaerales bacterium]
MRRPGIRFWRVVFAASVILFVAGVFVAIRASEPALFWPVSPTTAGMCGGRIVGVVWENPTVPRQTSAEEWKAGLNRLHVPGSPLSYRWLPRRRANSSNAITTIPASYICFVAALTGVSAALVAHRLAASFARTHCEKCSYSLAGLPADATACPECRGKIGKSTAEARTQEH